MMSWLRRHRWLLPLLVVLLVLVVSGVALARPGGGHSYSGGSRSSGSSSSGGGGGDGGVLFELLFLLVIEHPSIGIPVVILVVVVMVVRAAIQRGMKAWSTTPSDVSRVETVHRQGPAARKQLEQLRGLDPEFSLVLFEDFVYMLYAAVQRSRAIGAGPLAAYLAPNLPPSLENPALSDVQGIVIGALRYVDVLGLGSAAIHVELEVEANYVELLKTGQQHRYYVVDRVVLTRSATAKSRPFARASKLDCPNCGAPLEALHGTECSYCRQQVGFGRFDWMVASLSGLSREPRGPLLTGDVAESGTELPTIADAAAPQRFQELQQRDPALSWQGFTARIAHVFGELQGAWSGREPLRIRPYVSDNLFQSMLYWIDLYVAARCRNVTENARILRIDLAVVTSDKHYDAITVRLFATSVDYTVSDDGKLLSGSKSRARTYSEYWTWIRGTARRGASRGDVSCPNCGAPLRIGMAGTCASTAASRSRPESSTGCCRASSRTTLTRADPSARVADGGMKPKCGLRLGAQLDRGVARARFARVVSDQLADAAFAAAPAVRVQSVQVRPRQPQGADVGTLALDFHRRNAAMRADAGRHAQVNAR